MQLKSGYFIGFQTVPASFSFDAGVNKKKQKEITLHGSVYCNCSTFFFI